MTMKLNLWILLLYITIYNNNMYTCDFRSIINLIFYVRLKFNSYYSKQIKSNYKYFGTSSDEKIIS